ncbi:CAF17-like 4Fe-4S cluster assembly/insertion protein YgfZ [Polynucleobacter necessarius]|uniref:CAF17-like 4Fe-4S cluster assembly/insertion protein YgfZ n=1 Tax=Polynucleobacter necessarius TaxID=576610 RepID=UPI000E092E8D|nr:folate-binding protein YgfZ [Polynucleobacter necessarius]
MTQTSQNTLTQGQMPSSGLSALPDWGLILVEGPDALTFLQNQLTNSVEGLEPTLSPKIAHGHKSVRLIGYCSPKGRLLASAWVGLFPILQGAEDRFALFISKDIAASIAKRLSMFVLRSKVKISDASTSWNSSAFYSKVSELGNFSIEESQIGLRLPDVMLNNESYARILVAQEARQPSVSIDPAALRPINSLEVISAIPRIVAATQEEFVPQMINFESVAGVDFKKGCYPGQEIVARSQYRGVIKKRRLFLAHCLGGIEPAFVAPGVELFHSVDPAQPAGMVVLCAPSSVETNRVDFQIECKLEALETGQIHLGDVRGPVLKIDSLPYPLIEI